MCSPANLLLVIKVTPELINCLPQQLNKILRAVASLHLLVQVCYKPTQKTITIVQKMCCDIVSLVPPISLAWFHPVARCIPRLQPHKIRYPLC
ncbi:hypothetical protein BT93_I1581 [Corymbia citriodora subsp. variegata]|nr:hypothetical protein BT93_I1581 [Corymbia citriodora subsp. variegata]